MAVTSAAALVGTLERRILSGELTPGTRLDPVRVAAGRLGLAANTVAAAYKELSERGLVVARGRLGTFVEERFRPVGPLVPDVPPGVVDLASGRPDPRLLPDLAPYLAGLGGSTTTYGDPAVAPELEQALRPLLEAEEIACEPLVVTGGAVDAIERVLGAWLRPGDAVVVEDPGWFAIVDLIRAMGLQPVPVATDDQGLDPLALSDVSENVRAVVITPRAQNPTGGAQSANRVEDLQRALARRSDLVVIEDDHFGPVAGAPLRPLGPGRHRWALIRSFSKAYGPDLRLAVATGDPETIQRVQTRQCVGPGWVSHILQKTLASLLVSPEVAKCMDEATRSYQTRRRLLSDALENVGLEATGRSGVNVWVRIDDEERAVQACLQEGYAIRSGRRFRHRAPPGVRITVSELDAEGAEAVASAIAGRPSGPTTRMA